MAIEWIKIEEDGETPSVGDYVLFSHGGFVDCGEYDGSMISTSGAMIDFHECSHFAYINNPD